MKCNCENLNCRHCYGSACLTPASVDVICMYVGDICDICAGYMDPSYIKPRVVQLEMDPCFEELEASKRNHPTNTIPRDDFRASEVVINDRFPIV